MKKLSARKLGLLSVALLRPGDALRLPGHRAAHLPAHAGRLAWRPLASSGCCPCRGCSRRCGPRSWIATARRASAGASRGSSRCRRRSRSPVPPRPSSPCTARCPVLLGLIFLMNLFAATQDIAVDGLAVDSLRPRGAGLRATPRRWWATSWGCSPEAGCWSGPASTSAGRGCSSPWRRFQPGCLRNHALRARVRAPGGPEHRADELARGARPAQGGAAACREPAGCWSSSAPTSSARRCPTCSTSSSSSTLASGPSRSASGSAPGDRLASIAGSALGGLLASRVPLLRALTVTAVLRLFPLAGPLVARAHGRHGGGRHRRHPAPRSSSAGR